MTDKAFILPVSLVIKQFDYLLKNEEPFMWFIALFIVLPLAEIATFIQVGQIISTPTTLFLCLVTAIFGGYFVKKQGTATLFQAQKHLSQGQMPLQEMFDGLCLVMAGVMMMTPGFITDTIGFLLLIPAVRVFLRSLLTRTGSFKKNAAFHQPFDHKSNDNIIDGDYERVYNERDTLMEKVALDPTEKK